MDNNQHYELLEGGVVTKRFFCFQRMTEYIKENFSTTDVAILRLHGVFVREVASDAKPKI